VRQVKHIFADNREAQAFICGVDWVNDGAIEVIDVLVDGFDVIVSDTPDPLDGTPLYWQTDQGWVGITSADRFYSRDGINLPDGGSWESALTATVLVNDEDGDEDSTFDHREHV